MLKKLALGRRKGICVSMKQNEGYMQVNFLTLLRALWNRIWLVGLAVVLCAAAAFSIARFCVAPLYRSTVMMYVNNSSQSGGTGNTISPSDLSAAQSLVDTYVVILNTRSTLEEVAYKAGVNYTYDELKHMISAGAVNSTEVFKITADSPDPEEAYRLVNTVAQVLPARIAAVVEGSSVRVVDNAAIPTEKAFPSYSLCTLLGALIGFAAGASYVILSELCDDRIHDEEGLTRMYGSIPVLAVIPELAAASSGGYGYGGGYAAAGERMFGDKGEST